MPERTSLVVNPKFALYCVVVNKKKSRKKKKDERRSTNRSALLSTMRGHCESHFLHAFNETLETNRGLVVYIVARHCHQTMRSLYDSSSSIASPMFSRLSSRDVHEALRARRASRLRGRESAAEKAVFFFENETRRDARVPCVPFPSMRNNKCSLDQPCLLIDE